MPDLDPTALIEMTAEVVASYVTKNHVRVSELPDLISTIHASLAGMGSASDATPETAKLTPPVSIKKSVTDDYLISFEDGKRYISLKRHLSTRGLTPDEYRTKWGLTADYPMVTANHSARRSEMAKINGLGAWRRKA